jgi:hypothetical protein
MSALDEIRDELRRYGALRAAVGLGLRAVNRVVTLRPILFMRLRLEDLDPSALQPESPLECRFLTRAEIEHYAADPANRMPRKFLDRALAKGDECFAMLDGETLASFCWCTTRPTQLGLRARIHFDPKWVYRYHAHTRPEYRGLRLNSLGTARTILIYAERGHLGLMALLEFRNWAIRKACYRVGYRNLGWLLEWGPRNRTRIQLGARARAEGLFVTRADR